MATSKSTVIAGNLKTRYEGGQWTKEAVLQMLLASGGNGALFTKVLLYGCYKGVSLVACRGWFWFGAARAFHGTETRAIYLRRSLKEDESYLLPWSACLKNSTTGAGYIAE